MFRLLLALFFVTPTALGAVYRWVDPQGQIQFSDRPQPDAEAVEIKTPAPTDPAAPSASPDDQALSPRLGPYAGFEIVIPEANQTLRQSQEGLLVSLILDPPLIGGQQLELVLDGVPITVDKSSGTQIQLSGVAFGSHSLHAQIRNTQGIVVARTRLVPFHLRKPVPPGVLQ